MTKRIAYAFAVLGSVALLVAVGWWWVVFRTLIGNASLSVPAALPCLAQNSDLCVLAQALCTSNHWLGIRHYDTALFWVGAVIVVASALPGLARAASRRATSPPMA
jgi:hypothetical protein